MYLGADQASIHNILNLSELNQVIENGYIQFNPFNKIDFLKKFTNT